MKYSLYSELSIIRTFFWSLEVRIIGVALYIDFLWLFIKTTMWSLKLSTDILLGSEDANNSDNHLVTKLQLETY